MADRGTSFDRALAFVTAFEAAGETSAARMLLLTQIQDLIDAADATRAGVSKGGLTMGDHFCIVWNPDGMRPPRFRHDTADSAKKEAIRLGTENPGQTFHVLENIGHAKTPAAMFTSVFPAQLNIADVNLGIVTAGAATGRAVVFESTPNPSADDTWTQFGRYRGPTHIIADAEYIPGVKSKDGDPTADSLERAGAEVIRLRTWLHRIREATSGAGGISPRQRAIIHTACSEALTCEPPPFPNQAKASLPGFDEAASVEVEEKPFRIFVHGVYRPGDRVCYTGRGPGRFLPDAMGTTGTFVEEGDSGFCAVDWDANSGAPPSSATHINNLEHETLPRFVAGDIVYIRDWPTRMPHEVLAFFGGHASLRPQAGPPTQPVKIQDLVLLVPVQRKGEKR